MKISMYLSDTSKYWWTYLAMKSNHAIARQMADGCERAVFFDDSYIGRIPDNRHFHDPGSKLFYVCWDGLNDLLAIDRIKAMLAHGSRLTTLVVGEAGVRSASGHQHAMEGLYADQRIAFNIALPAFDLATGATIALARCKAALMPLKNIVKHRNLSQSLRLLLGSKKYVFCGTYGTGATIVRHLCGRHGVDLALFDGYDHGSSGLASLADCKVRLQGNAARLFELHAKGKINTDFLRSAIHLLGRGYFIERLRHQGLDNFVNGADTGINVNVYTTPFYAQHVFLDFGSVVGSGNYPRLMDLRYFKKHVVQIDLHGIDLDKFELALRAGSASACFDELWREEQFRA